MKATIYRRPARSGSAFALLSCRRVGRTELAKRHVPGLTSNTCGRDRAWKEGLWRKSLVQERTHWIRVGPNETAGILIRRNWALT